MRTDFISNSELRAATKNSGFIYILKNPSYPDCVKVGKTTRLPGIRAAELSGTTAVPTPFSVVYCRFVDNLNYFETTIHKSLKNFRVNSNREFFELSVPEAKKMVDDIVYGCRCAVYNNVLYRQKQDAKWAIFFDCIKIRYEYLTEPVTLGEWMSFRPDFWLPAQDCYVVISRDFFSTDTGRMAAHCFAQKTGKMLIQLYDCEPARDYDAMDTKSNFEFYIKPGSSDNGTFEWGVCKRSEAKNLETVLLSGSDQSPAHRNSEKSANPLLDKAYKAANNYFK